MVAFNSRGNSALRRFHIKRGALIPIIALFILAGSSVISFPNLSVEHSVACRECHISGAGGGARTEFGNYAVALNELTLEKTKKWAVEKYRKPRIAPSLLVGFDSRHLVLEDGTVFRMQSDLFVTFEPFEGLQYHTRLTENGARENYGQLLFCDNRFYVRAGRFAPAFGLKQADHQGFNRARTGNGTNIFLDGASIGGELYGVNVALESFNQFGQELTGIHAFRVGSIGSFGYLAGLSSRFSERMNGNYGLYPPAKSLFGGVSWNRFTLLGEGNLIGKYDDAVATYYAVHARIIWGLYAVGEYNFYDSDRRFKNGIEEWVRTSIDFYPVPFVQIRPSYTRYLRDFTGTKDERDVVFLQFHVGY
ncbi:MAG: hypothetical protein AAB305_02040 [Candidatus Zixiibacteriota bacterium]